MTDIIPPTWKSADGAVMLWHGDCLPLIPTLNMVSGALVTDPPYGTGGGRAAGIMSIDNATEGHGFEAVEGDDESFDPRPILEIGEQQIIWGANHFADLLPARARWLVWDKRDGVGSNPLADCELAWTSDTRPARLLHHRWMGMIRVGAVGERIHPNEKPHALMAWCMEVLDIPRDITVCDPYMGVGNTGIACLLTGRRFAGVEKEAKYFAAAVARIKMTLEHLDEGGQEG